jgi:Domain of unknown function (DUF389)
MAFGSTLGDRELIVRAAITNTTSVGLSVACAAAAALLVPADSSSVDLLARTRLGYDSIVLA